MRRWTVPALAAFAVVVGGGSLLLGRYPIPVGEVGRYLGWRLVHLGSMEPVRAALLDNVLLDMRLPRIAAAGLIGAALSVAGVALQAILGNPLMSSKTTGVMAGSSFGAAVGVLLGRDWLTIQVLAVVFGLVAVGVTVAIARLGPPDSLLMLVLGGIASDAIFMALVTVATYLADPNRQLPTIVYWLMGSLAAIDRRTVGIATLPMLAGIGILLLLGKQLNGLSMGDEEARALGIPVGRVRLGALLCATTITALTVAMGGMIVWVGVIVPHLARMLVGSDNQVLLPAAALLGAGYLIAVDDVSRLLFQFEIPMSVVTSLIGVPVFVTLLRSAKRGWA
jgi:iron complex transport system permease protein